MTTQEAAILGYPIRSPISLPINMSEDNSLAAADHIPNVVKKRSDPPRCVKLILDGFNDNQIITLDYDIPISGI